MLQAADRDEREWRLGRERPQIARQRRDLPRRCTDDLTTDGASRSKIALAARVQARHDARILEIDAEACEVREVTRARDEQLRANLRIRRERRAAVEHQGREAEARRLDREGETHRSRADDR